MRIFYRACQGKRTCVIYEAVRTPRPCCGEMERHWGKLIGFGVPGTGPTTSNEVNLCMAVPQANSKTACVLVPINFCPFCGQLIEVCRVKSTRTERADEFCPCLSAV